MKIIFCPTMFSDIKDDIKNTKNPLPVSEHKYQKNLLKGIVDKGQEITVLDIPRLRYYPDYPQMVLGKATFTLNGTECGYN